MLVRVGQSRLRSAMAQLRGGSAWGWAGGFGPGSVNLPRRSRSISCRVNCHSLLIKRTARTTSTTTMAAVQYGCSAAIHTRNTTSPSSNKLSTQLLTGSGLVLAAARVLALAPCDVSATLPASSAAPSFHSSDTFPKALYDKTAAAGGRMKVWTASQALST